MYRLLTSSVTTRSLGYPIFYHLPQHHVFDEPLCRPEKLATKKSHSLSFFCQFNPAEDPVVPIHNNWSEQFCLRGHPSVNLVDSNLCFFEDVWVLCI